LTPASVCFTETQRLASDARLGALGISAAC
jgi:hypothetical protein